MRHIRDCDTMLPMKPTFVIGDVHGHFDRISLLLEQEGIIDADGNRIRYDCEVIQLGDLGHFGKGGSPTGDMLCYENADEWFDGLCWGNHDRPVVQEKNVFQGYEHPGYITTRFIKKLMEKNKIRMAWAKNGYLLTHAGLHADIAKGMSDPEQIAKWINNTPESWYPIGSLRGGNDPHGGVLWRDAREKLNESIPQVFGHTKNHEVRQYYTKSGTSYCIDVGSPTNGRLAGIWLPDRQVVEINTLRVNEGSQVAELEPLG